MRSTAPRRRLSAGIAAMLCALVLGAGVTWATVTVFSNGESDAAEQTMDRRSQDVTRTIINEISQFQDSSTTSAGPSARRPR